MSGMDPFVLVEWESGKPATWHPATVGLAWRLEELVSADDTADGTSERELYQRGWRWCECYSVFSPEGEEGFFGIYNLVPLQPAELDAARAALRRNPAEFKRTVEVLVDRAARRWL
jgi:hypothetical protein